MSIQLNWFLSLTFVCALINLWIVRNAFSLVRQVRNSAQHYSDVSVVRAERSAKGRYELSDHLPGLASSNWSEVQLAWNELTLELDELRSIVALYRRSLPRICAFIGLFFAALSWVVAGELSHAVVSVCIGLAGMASVFFAIYSAQQGMKEVLNSVKPIETRVLRRQRDEIGKQS